MIVYTVEQYKGIAQGLTFASRVSDVLSSGVLYPFVILLFIYALAWFSVQHSNGRKSLVSLFVYLVIASVFLYLSLEKGIQKLVFEPIIFKEGAFYVGDIQTKGKSKVDYNSKHPPSYRSADLKVPGVPLGTELFSFFDQIADGLYRAVMTLDTHKVGDSLEKQNVCFSPERMGRRALFSGLVKGIKEVKNVDYNCMGKFLSNYFNRVVGLEGKDGTWSPQYDEIGALGGKNRIDRQIATVSDAQIAGRLQTLWATVKRKIKDNEIDTSVGWFQQTFLNCNAKADSIIEDVIAWGVLDTINECKKYFSSQGGSPPPDEVLMQEIEGYITSPKYARKLARELGMFLAQTDSSYRAITNNSGEGAWNGLREMVSGAIQVASVFAATNLNFDVYTKMRLLMEIQGIALGFIVGFLPIVLILSLFPMGDSMINTKLLVSYFSAYLLVKLWFPAVMLIYMFAWNKLFLPYLSKIM